MQFDHLINYRDKQVHLTDMNRINKTFLFLIAVCIVSIPLSAGAATTPENIDSIRCGIFGYVHPWETKRQVFKECGPPDAEFSCRDYDSNGEIKPMEKWTYNFGPEDFVYNFIFRNGQLEEIEQIGRGF